MLGRVNWWDKEGGVGSVIDVDGKEWHVSDDMIDADELKSKMGKGLVINFEPNPSLDNSAMSLDIASPDDSDKFKSDYKAAMKEKEPKEGAEIGSIYAPGF